MENKWEKPEQDKCGRVQECLSKALAAAVEEKAEDVLIVLVGASDEKFSGSITLYGTIAADWAAKGLLREAIRWLEEMEKFEEPSEGEK